MDIPRDYRDRSDPTIDTIDLGFGTGDTASRAHYWVRHTASSLIDYGFTPGQITETLQNMLSEQDLDERVLKLACQEAKMAPIRYARMNRLATRVAEIVNKDEQI